MGKLFNTPLFVCLLLIIVCFLMISCQVAPPTVEDFQNWIPEDVTSDTASSGQGGHQASLENQRITAGIHCVDVRRDECYVRVTINPVTEAVNLSIMVHANNGVKFLPSLDVIPSKIGDNATHDLTLITGESRVIDFPYQPNLISGQNNDKVPNLPGAYKIDVVATDSNTSDVYYDTYALAFLWLDDFGDFHSEQSLESLRGRIGDAFVPGAESGLNYFIRMEQGARPYRGYIWLWARSQERVYNPVITIEASDVVVFRDDRIWAHEIEGGGDKVTVHFPQMRDDGVRIARIPFEMDRSGSLMDGTYVFLVGYSVDGSDFDYETMPIMLQLHSDPQYQNERWLSKAPAASLPATPTPDMSTLGIGDKVGLLSDDTEGLNLDKLCADLENVRFNQEVVRNIDWSRQISKFDGSLCKAYLEYVAFKVPMSWSEFRETAVSMNQNLSSTQDSLVSYETYIFPELD